MKWSAALSLLLTVLLITLLSVRMAAGADPALGPKIVRSSSQSSQSASGQSTQPPGLVPDAASAPVQQVPTPAAPVQQVPTPVAPVQQVPTPAAPVQQVPVAPVQTTTS